MKIIRTIESFYPKVHGPANQAFRISSELEKAGIRSPVWTTNFDVDKKAGHEKINNVDVLRFPFFKNFLKYVYSPLMKKALNREYFDIIHTHCYRSYQTDIAFKIAKKKRKAFVLSTHGTLLSYKHFVNKAWQSAYAVYDFLTSRNAVLNADAVIVNSSQEYDEALEFGVKKDRLHLIPVGIDTEEYKCERAFKEKERLNLLYVGGITHNRPLEPVIRAIKKINESEIKKKVFLTIVGDEARSSFSDKKGYLRELQNMVNMLELNYAIKFVGRKEGKELKEHYKNADAFVYPSLYESFGQPILEAAASGLPVICSNTGAARDLIKDNENGFIIDINNVDEIAEKIAQISDPELREEFSLVTSAIVESSFKWESVIGRYIELYNKLK